MKPVFLTPGPSELYFTVEDHIRQALKENACAISHRSKAFEAYYKTAVDNVRALLNVPESYHIVFTASATEVWERLIQNCVENQTYHLVNGSFSKRFYEFSGMLGKNAIKLEKPLGEGFTADEIDVPTDTEMLCITQNETSTGVSVPVEEIYALRKKYPECLIAIDAVSSVPYLDIDFNKIDSLFFSVQKGMGMPAGLGVWIFNERCVSKATTLTEKQIPTGTYHSIESLLEKAVNNQTPETPNVLGIYVLGKVCEDMLRRGVDVIRQETNYKAALINYLYNEHPMFSHAVANETHRSKTVLVGEVKGMPASELIAKVKEHGIVIGSGYGKNKATQIRIANFPTHSKEVFEKLVDVLNEMK
ncbi:aminotransferase class V-fold PLP-dependent enzyme [Chondrinema litorale]|uniref:aminotransferase class V-fold PLP-dependent enzyme n=1 Tax=Chondrinema litorale TaxID=2994555 RepID=UPI0025435538|nr:aminotransferase class V-fold PLP-dependent enzyme [Chondrinema litorale]UZR95025.1 aminotransferase class V-fold PLP-dependent enzyme [Chondrinema litorale]